MLDASVSCKVSARYWTLVIFANVFELYFYKNITTKENLDDLCSSFIFPYQKCASLKIEIFDDLSVVCKPKTFGNSLFL